MQQKAQFSIGHILIKVNDLTKAVQDFEELGFNSLIQNYILNNKCGES